MQIETTLFFESLREIYARVFSHFKPHVEIPNVAVCFRKYANANSRISLSEGKLIVKLPDILRGAPAPVQEALAFILIAKLLRKPSPPVYLARYRRYLNRMDVRQSLYGIRKERGRKQISAAMGDFYDLNALFETVNFQYFHGLFAKPDLGWSLRTSQSTLGHYDPAHHTIVLSKFLDSPRVPELAVKYVMFHEMLHLKFPPEHRGIRRRIHTPEFKEAERSFERLREAKELLQILAGQSECQGVEPTR